MFISEQYKYQNLQTAELTVPVMNIYLCLQNSNNPLVIVIHLKYSYYVF